MVLLAAPADTATPALASRFPVVGIHLIILLLVERTVTLDMPEFVALVATSLGEPFGLRVHLGKTGRSLETIVTIAPTGCRTLIV